VSSPCCLMSDTLQPIPAASVAQRIRVRPLWNLSQIAPFLSSSKFDGNACTHVKRDHLETLLGRLQHLQLEGYTYHEESITYLVALKGLQRADHNDRFTLPTKKCRPSKMTLLLYPVPHPGHRIASALLSSLSVLLRERGCWVDLF
jgi:hypothetical protein